MNDTKIILHLTVTPEEDINIQFGNVPMTAIRRAGFNGELIVTCIVTVGSAIIPSIIDIIYDMRKRKKLKQVEYGGITIEGDSEESIAKVIAILQANYKN